MKPKTEEELKEEIENDIFEGRLTYKEAIYKSFESGKQEAQKSFEELIDKKIFGYESEEGTHDFISEAVLRVLKELKSEFREKNEN